MRTITTLMRLCWISKILNTNCLFLEKDLILENLYLYVRYINSWGMDTKII